MDKKKLEKVLVLFARKLEADRKAAEAASRLAVEEALLGAEEYSAYLDVIMDRGSRCSACGEVDCECEEEEHDREGADRGHQDQPRATPPRLAADADVLHDGGWDRPEHHAGPRDLRRGGAERRAGL